MAAYQVACALSKSGRPDAAEQLAVSVAENTHIDPRRLPANLHSRRAQVHLDLAWALVQRRRNADAIPHLLEAERIAAETVRHDTKAREIVTHMLTRGRHTPAGTVHDLAARVGVLA